jgi:hypothetical protein
MTRFVGRLKLTDQIKENIDGQLVLRIFII